MITIPKTLPKEITDKYKIVNNSFRHLKKDDVKDRITVEVGDVKDANFIPQMKISRWGITKEDNECNVSLRLIEDDNEKPTLETESEKIKYIKRNRECHFYQIQNEEHPEGASEFEIILKKDPRKNKGEDYTLEFSLEDKDVKYLKQTEERKQFENGEWNCKENVPGSYAIYAKTPKTNWASPHIARKKKIEIRIAELQTIISERPVSGYVENNTVKEDLELFDLQNELPRVEQKIADDTTIYKEYKRGKIGHIFRPKHIDAVGKESWGILDINQKEKRLRATIPADFLDNAVYPIRHAAGLTFGFEDIGEYLLYLTSDTVRGFYKFSPASDGTINKLTLYTNQNPSYTGTVNLRGVVYKHSDYSLITYGGEVSYNNTDAALWRDLNVTDDDVLSANDYFLGCWIGAGASIYPRISYDTDVVTMGMIKDNETYHATNSPPGTIASDDRNTLRIISIYATYTAGGGAPKDVTDIGSGADAVSVKCQTPVTDSGQGADTAEILASMNLTDVGSGADTISITQLKTLLETGAGADIISLVNKLAVTDNGAGAEIISILGQIAVTETAAGNEALSVLSELAITDTGAGADAITALIQVAATDTGAGAEALSILFKIATTDSGAGSEIINILTQLVLTDTGAGADIVDKVNIGSDKQVTDSGTGSEALSILTQLALTDTGTGAEAVSALIELSVTDSGTGTEIINLLLQILQTDAGSGSEVIQILKQMAVSDSGIANEAITALVQLAVSETGLGSDVESVSGNIKQISETGTGAEALSVLTSLAIQDTGAGIEILEILNQLAVTETGSGADVASKEEKKDITDSGSGADTVAFAKQLLLLDSGVGTDSIMKQNIAAAIATILSALDKKANIKLTDQVKAKIKKIINN